MIELRLSTQIRPGSVLLIIPFTKTHNTSGSQSDMVKNYGDQLFMVNTVLWQLYNVQLLS